MTARILADTNLLVYCYDPSAGAKQQQAVETVQLLATHGIGALSTQVLGEFVATVTRKIPRALTLDEAAGRVAHYLAAWTVFDVTTRVVQEAIRGARAHQFNYWDAQIWAVARLHRIPYLLSEDFSNGVILEGVRFLDPFRAGFRAADLLKS